MRFALHAIGLVAIVSPALASCGGTTSSGADAGGLTTSDPGNAITGGTVGNGGAVSLDAACVANVQEGEALPVNLLFLVDKSGSMTCPLGPLGQTCGIGNNQPPNNAAPLSRWSAITEALTAFVNAPASAGIGIGLQFFPKPTLAGNPGSLGGFGGIGGLGAAFNASCNPADYQVPVVDLDVLPRAAAHFTMVLGAATPQGNTPTTPALQGAIAVAKNQEVADPSRVTSVVLTSDGIPNGCASTVGNAAAAVAAGFGGSPPVRTYVIGVGPELTNLNQIAAVGGSKSAFLIDTGNPASQVAADLTAALGAIAAPIGCDYAIPRTPGKALDYSAVNVQTRTGEKGPSQLVAQVANAGACGASGGWFYDNPAQPTKITLCPATCEPITTTKGSHLQILIGCATHTTIR